MKVLEQQWFVVVTLMSLLTISVHGQCPVSQQSAAYCKCNYEDNNGYTISRSIVCTGLNDNTTLSFSYANDIFVDFIVTNSSLQKVPPYMFSRVKARNFQMSRIGISEIDDNAFLGAEDYMESLDLKYNNIASLPPGIFKHLQQLRVLDLSNNELTSIDSTIFEGLYSTTYLNLGRNTIFQIGSAAFSGMPNLKTLLLDSNVIEEVSDNTFKGIEKLELLLLSSNRITSISADALAELPNLKSLYLALNDLTSLPEHMLRMNELLEILALSSNSLTTIPENLFFRNKNLMSIDMSHNELKNLDKFPFKKLEKLETLNLRSNKIKSILTNVFEDLQSVILLDLSHNDIEYLQENGLVGLAVAETVLLHNNKISVVPYGIFDAIGNVVYLNISMNLIEHFEDSVPFLANGMLEELDLSWNKIQEIPPSLFEKTRALRKLTMAHNEISILYADSFINVPNLEELDLRHNRINTPPGNLFANCGKLKNLRLSWNPLRQLSRSFLVGLNDLEEVNLDHGCLEDLPDGLFTPGDDTVNPTTSSVVQQPNPLTKLKVAHLNSNFLRNVTKKHIEGAKLTMLNIQENNISWVDPAIFERSTILNYANLSRNLLGSSINYALSRMKSVKILDLTYNQIDTLSRSTLERDTTFEELYMEGNPILCDCRVAFLRAYDSLKDFDALQCGSASNLAEEFAVCFSTSTQRCASWPNHHRGLCSNYVQDDLKKLTERLQWAAEQYMAARSRYENFCVIETKMTTSSTVAIDPSLSNNSTISLPEITNISPIPDSDFVRVEWIHTDINLVSGYRLRYTPYSNNVTYTSELVDDRLWYIINNTYVKQKSVICVDMVLLDGQVRSDESHCRLVEDLTVEEVKDKSDKSGLLQLLLPIIAVASVLVIIIVIIIGVRISLRRKRHRDKQQQAQKVGMWDFPFPPNFSEELVEQSILPYQISEVIIDPKFHLKRLKSTIKDRKTKRVKRRKSRGRNIPSVAGSMRSSMRGSVRGSMRGSTRGSMRSSMMGSMRSYTSTKSDSSLRSTNSLDDVNTDLFVSSDDSMLPPPYSESINGSVRNGSLRNGSVRNGSLRNGSLRNGSIHTNGSVNSGFSH